MESKMKLKYYGDAYDKDEHERIISLLNGINEKWGTTVEIIRLKKRHEALNFRGEIAENSEIEAYNRDFRNNRVLSRNIGRPPSKGFKTGSGYISITGVVGVVMDNTLQWAKESYLGGIEFLEDFQRSGFKAIEDRGIKFGEKVPKGDLHDELFGLLVRNNLPEKETSRENKCWLREIVVGFNALGIKRNDRKIEHGKNIASKLEGNVKKAYETMCKFDLVDKIYYRGYLQEYLSSRYGFGRPLMVLFIDYVALMGEKIAWLMEGKEKLNEKAIGQLLVYKDLFEEDYPFFDKVKLGVVIKADTIINPILLRSCKKYNIEVFEVK